MTSNPFGRHISNHPGFISRAANRVTEIKFLSLLLIGSSLVMSLITAHAEAGVNLKNGNYYITYTDISLPGRRDLDIERTYNSRSAKRGIFGVGWGSDYETSLEVQGDGTVLIRENGSGARTLFRPPTLSKDEIEQAVDAIIKAANQDNIFSDDNERREKRDELMRDAEVRANSWTQYVKKGLLEPRRIPIGTVYRTSTRGQQRLLRTHDGFQRSNGNQTDEFDATGALIRISYGSEGNDYLFRNAQGQLSRIVDHEGRELRFHFNNEDTVSRIDATGGDSVVYQYDGSHLVHAKDQSGNHFTYRYDSNANLITIGNDDGSSRSITYTGTEFGGSQLVRSVTERDGSTTWYDYGSIYKSNEGEAYYTEVITVRPGGDSRTNRYEYWITYRGDGSSYTQRTRTVINGMITDTSYDANGTPINIQRGNQDTQFEYDARGRLTLKDNGRTITRLFYNDTVNKISKVIRHPVEYPEEAMISEFEYDSNGNLVTASNSDGERIHLTYNGEGQIVRSESEDTILTFTYNAMNKPTTIAIEGLGSLSVSYDEYGEITKVESPEGGHQLALRITQSFQALLSLVKPAGVDLSM